MEEHRRLTKPRKDTAKENARISALGVGNTVCTEQIATTQGAIRAACGIRYSLSHSEKHQQRAETLVVQEADEILQLTKHLLKNKLF